ncbi:phage major capsid protein [Oceanispirochaeta sp.]|jgi:HK97 family phage major capsid protein|uniref:phage major capsid protein n=1 Tax=Oceanispirochaeta sp. TaxID=2035350 RepID=UPI002607C036|nr:phage major capsid protein [Oceanispirochaeta sp.]MDA3957461.1 phage major capsid protein [Oceanispirochaeta sp.]
MKELLKKLMGLLETMKRIETDGFPDEGKAKQYFEEKEEILEAMAQALGQMDKDHTLEIEGLKGTIKLLKETVKGQAGSPKILSLEEFHYNLGKTIAGVWRNNQSLLGELKSIPNFKGESWVNPKDLSWEAGKGWTSKASLGTPMGDMVSNDQYLINPIYETQIMTDARKNSIMMGLVSNRPMSGPSLFLPQRDRGGILLNWLTSYGQQITDSKPSMGQRVELKAYTLAGFIPWFDEFEEDIYADLGQMFVEEFTDAYGQEFDKQCLIADAAPFTGALACEGIVSHFIKSSSPYGLTYLDFREAVLKVPAEERRQCSWFLHESILSRVTSLQDSDGRPVWRGPTDGKPGLLDGYPYHECDMMPQGSEIKKNEPFAIFMNPKRIQHGNRKGLELKRFDGTTESLQYGEIFLRFRKRDGFLITRPEKNMVTMKCKSS